MPIFIKSNGNKLVYRRNNNNSEIGFKYNDIEYIKKSKKMKG